MFPLWVLLLGLDLDLIEDFRQLHSGKIVDETEGELTLHYDASLLT